MKPVFLSFLLIPVMLFCNCKPSEILFHDVPNNTGVSIAIKKAKQMSNIIWMPKGTIPNNQGDFQNNELVKGLPYSSVKEIDTFIGYDVSIHTFMTAVNNPRSILYGTDVGKKPYYGVNCSTYYGVVCNTFVGYALGLKIHYRTFDYINNPEFEIVKEQTPYAMKLCDVLYQKGHISLVVDITRNSDGEILFVSLAEAASRGVYIREYDIMSFVERWNQNELVLCRYLNISNNVTYNSSPFVLVDDEITPAFSYNNDVCTSKGDQVCYRNGEEIKINILSNAFSEFELLSNDNILSSIAIENNDILLSDLEPGLYQVRLKRADSYSKSIFFEVLQTDCSVILTKPSNIVFKFSTSYGIPVYAEICQRNGAAIEFFNIEKEDVERGYLDVHTSFQGDCYLKIHYQGQYGRVTNIPYQINIQ